jgi:hypothetical protein
MANLTANNLKNTLWEVLTQVKEGKMDCGQADAIASQAREILRTTKVQLQISHQSKRPVPVDVLNFNENQ